MTRILPAIALFYFSGLLNAQTFQKIYGENGNDYGNCVIQTGDGGYLMGGRSQSLDASYDNSFIVRTDAVGDTLWTRRFGGNGDDVINTVLETNDGGYVFAGTVRNFAPDAVAMHLVRADENGDTLWTKSYWRQGYEFGRDIQQTDDNGFIFVGSALAGFSTQDILCVRTDQFGDTIWTRSYGGSGYEYAYSVKQTADGGFVVAGSSDSFGIGGSDAYILKIAADGSIEWSKTYGGQLEDEANSIILVEEGGYLVAGMTQSSGAGSNDYYLIRLDTTGDTLWTKAYGNSSINSANSVKQTADGGFIIAGASGGSGISSSDLFLIKTNSSGDTTWTRALSDPYETFGFDVDITDDGGYIACGFTNHLDFSSRDACLLKTDANGNWNGCNQHHNSCSVNHTLTTITDAQTIMGYTLNISPVDVTMWSGTVYSDICNPDHVEQLTEPAINVFPNPFSATITVGNTSPNGVISLYDVSGKNVMVIRCVSTSTSIDTSVLSGGYYLLTYLEEGKPVYRPLVKP